MGHHRTDSPGGGTLSMEADPRRRTAIPVDKTAVALVCIALWSAAAASADRVGVWLALGGAATVLGLAVFVLDRPGFRDLLRPSSRLGLLGVAVGVAMAAATHVVYPVLARLVPLIASDAAGLYDAFQSPSRAVAALALAPVILGEELVWRGAVQEAFARRLGPAGGVLLAASAYALALAPLGSPILVLAALLCGLSWGALRAATGSLVPPLLAHLVWDALVLLWLPLDPGGG